MEREWVSCKEKLPQVVESSLESYCTIEKSKLVLVQTNNGQMFIAHFQRWSWLKDRKEELDWYSYGTKGRKMRVMNKVIAWMPLPERYVEVCGGK